MHVNLWIICLLVCDNQLLSMILIELSWSKTIRFLRFFPPQTSTQYVMHGSVNEVKNVFCFVHCCDGLWCFGFKMINMWFLAEQPSATSSQSKTLAKMQPRLFLCECIWVKPSRKSTSMTKEALLSIFVFRGARGALLRSHQSGYF